VELQVFGNGNDENVKNGDTTLATTPKLESCFDASAGVAIGVAVEEAVTASLLPLAGLHVLRCRAVEDMEVTEDDTIHSHRHDQTTAATSRLTEPSYSNKRVAIHPVTGEKVELDMEKIDWKNEKSFQEWTLPPEEAILKLQEQGLISPTVNHFLAAPCRRYSTKEPSNPTQPPPHPPSRLSAKDYYRLWGKRHNVNPNILASNAQVFSPFLHPVHPEEFNRSQTSYVNQKPY
jgi:hypothetical protein